MKEGVFLNKEELLKLVDSLNLPKKWFNSLPSVTVSQAVIVEKAEK